MITTNSRAAESMAPAEPRKLDIRTTTQLPADEPELITRGADLSKMITTHDMDDERDVEDMRQNKSVDVSKKKRR